MKNKELVEKLIRLGYHISFAESCTGGLLASAIVDIPSASLVLNESFVTYSNASKVKYLGVLEETIERYGVVSEEVAKEMVVGVCNQAGTECGISITGVAGPTGGRKDKPVGMVCFGLKVLDEVFTFKMIFKNSERNVIRLKSTELAIEKMLFLLEK